MSRTHCDVLASGAVCLGGDVVCDGFANEYRFRVQTHVHDDHMADFSRSKGLQDIYLSSETLDLLVAEFNADLEYRSNLIRVKRDGSREITGGAWLSLRSANHMLGSCQVALEFSDGYRVGYSGDFGWPLEEIIEVDELVVDSTYGSPRSIRHYSQREAEERLVELVYQRLKYGSVHIKAYRGTIERVLHLIDGNLSIPVLGSERLIREVSVYQQHGYPGGGLLSVASNDAKQIFQDASVPHVHLYAKGDVFPNEMIRGTVVMISAFMLDGIDPMISYSDRSYKVALSNHADFNETLAYVAETGARRVITDNTRGHGVELAMAINERVAMGIAEPSSNRLGMRW